MRRREFYQRRGNRLSLTGEGRRKGSTGYRHTEEWKAQLRARFLSLHEGRREKGLCSSCGLAPKAPDRKVCPSCYAKILERPKRTKNPNARTIASARERKRKLKVYYKLTDDQLDCLLEKQSQVCAICGKPDPKQNLSIDHDHKTGRVRGLLCESHNLGLGKFQDNPALLRAAADYLEREEVECLKEKDAKASP
jgi:hypothetical protein